MAHRRSPNAAPGPRPPPRRGDRPQRPPPISSRPPGATAATPTAPKASTWHRRPAVGSTLRQSLRSPRGPNKRLLGMAGIRQHGRQQGGDDLIIYGLLDRNIMKYIEMIEGICDKVIFDVRYVRQVESHAKPRCWGACLQRQIHCNIWLFSIRSQQRASTECAQVLLYRTIKCRFEELEHTVFLGNVHERELFSDHVGCCSMINGHPLSGIELVDDRHLSTFVHHLPTQLPIKKGVCQVPVSLPWVFPWIQMCK